MKKLRAQRVSNFSYFLFFFSLTDFNERLNFRYLMLPDSGCFFHIFLRNFFSEIGVLAPKIDPLAHASTLTPTCAIYVKLVAISRNVKGVFFHFSFMIPLFHLVCTNNFACLRLK